MFVVSLDSSIVNVALPSIRQNIGTAEARAPWVLDGYTLTLTALLISSGALADRGGRRRYFRIGLLIFGAGSLLCSLASNFAVLIGARVLQGVGGSMLNPVALAIISAAFTDRAARARAIGVWGAVLGIAMALGPVVGGLLTDTVGWRAIFWINIPVCVLAALATTRIVPESFGSRQRHPDIPGQALTAATMFLFVLAVLELPRTNPRTSAFWLITVVAVLTATVAWLRAKHCPEPFIDPGYFRKPPFCLSVLCGMFASGGQGVLVYALSVSLQASGDNAITAGLHLVPIALGTTTFSALSGRALARLGPAIPLALGGLGIAAAGATLLAHATNTAGIAVAATCFGAGFGLANAPITTTAATGMGPNAGAASGVVSTSRQLGMSIGVAFAGAVAAPQANLTQPSWIAILICGIAITGCALALIHDHYPDSRNSVPHDARVR